mgnify:CR=1 FL=1
MGHAGAKLGRMGRAGRHTETGGIMTLAQASAAWREHYRRCWYCRGMAKKVKINAMTNTLSIDSDFSIMKPV